jgi:hypothetical protein
MSELTSDPLNSDPEPDPEPIGPDRYIDAVVGLTYRFQDGLRYTRWESDHQSTITLQPSKIRSNLSRKAFLNYVNLSIDERFQLEAAASMTMESLDGRTPWYDMKTMINHTPLLFDQRGGAIISRRDDDAKTIAFESDVIDDLGQYRVLLGGLATILYYTDYPHLLETVE